MQNTYTPTERTRLRRKTQRAAYDADTVHAILDAGLIAHIAYVDDGQAVVTPTTYWREGGHVYWHGSAAGRALRVQAQQRVCLTVSMVDGVVLGRSGFTHSMLYRSVMAFGVPEPVTDAADKRPAMDAMIDGLYPGRTREMRAAHDSELAAITVVRLKLEEVSAKVRGGGVIEVPADLGAPCWAGIVP
ncbi:MAG TPA: pyridoxamine 5'-phosphate oxidase family protein, partial [bacterium]